MYDIATLQTHSIKEVYGKFKDLRIDWKVNVTYNVTISNCSSVCWNETIFNDTNETTITKCNTTCNPYNLTKWRYEWRTIWKTLIENGTFVDASFDTEELNTNGAKVWEETEEKGYTEIRFCGNFERERVGGKGWVIALDHVPEFKNETYTNYTWWNDSWPYRRNITINNTQNSNTLIDYQVLINITYDSDMNSNFSDLRFTWYNSSDDTEIEIPYCLGKDCDFFPVPSGEINLTTVNGEFTDVIIKVPKIPSNGYTTIYVYYGNSNATSKSNPNETMTIKEDFDCPSGETPPGWYEGPGESDYGTCDGSGNVDIGTTSASDPDSGSRVCIWKWVNNSYGFYVKERYYIPSAQDLTHHFLAWLNGTDRYRDKHFHQRSGYVSEGKVAVRYTDNHGEWHYGTPGWSYWGIARSKIYKDAQGDEHFKVSVTRESDGASWSAEDDYGGASVWETYNLHKSIKVGMGIGGYGASGSFKVDYFYLMKYTEPQPTYEIGEEETPAPTTALQINSFNATNSYRVNETITIQGTDFYLGGQPYKFLGMSTYYLVDYATNHTYDDDGNEINNSRKYVLEVLDEMKYLNLNMLRTWAFEACGYANHQYSVWDCNKSGGHYNAFVKYSPGNYSDEMFEALDWLVYEASKRDIRLILALVNNWNDYGGMRWWVQTASTTNKTYENITDTSDDRYWEFHDQFYSNAEVKQNFKDYLTYFMNRTNPYTGYKYSEEPTIAFWELANEPRAKSDGDGSQGLVKKWAKEMFEHLIINCSVKQPITIGMEGWGTPWEGTKFIEDHNYSNVNFTSFNVNPYQWDWFAERSEHETDLDWADEGWNTTKVIDWWTNKSSLTWNNRWETDYQPNYDPNLGRHGYKDWVRQHVEWSEVNLSKPTMIGEFLYPLGEGKVTGEEGEYATYDLRVRFFNQSAINFFENGGDGILFWVLTHDDYYWTTCPTSYCGKMDDGFAFYISNNETLKNKSQPVIDVVKYLVNSGYVRILNNYKYDFTFNISKASGEYFTNATLIVKNLTDNTWGDWIRVKQNTSELVEGNNTISYQFDVAKCSDGCTFTKEAYAIIEVCTNLNCTNSSQIHLVLRTANISVTLNSPIGDKIEHEDQVDITFELASDLDVSYCKLFVNGTEEQVIFSPKSGIHTFTYTPSVRNAFFTYCVECLDVDDNSITKESNFTYEGSPRYQDVSVDVPSTYDYNYINKFNITWTDMDGYSIDTAYLEANFTGVYKNYTMMLIDPYISEAEKKGVYHYNLSSLPAKTYRYRFLANASDGVWNSTPYYTFTIQKSPTAMTLIINGSQANKYYWNGSTIEAMAYTSTRDWYAKTIKITYNISGKQIQVSGPEILVNTTLIYDLTQPYNSGKDVAILVNATFEGDENQTSSTKSYYAIIDFTSPKYSNLKYPSDQYWSSLAQVFEFNSTWIDEGVGLDWVKFELDGINYTPSKKGNEYYYKASGLSSGLHTWKWYAKDKGNSNTNSTGGHFTLIAVESPQGVSYIPSAGETVYIPTINVTFENITIPLTIIPEELANLTIMRDNEIIFSQMISNPITLDLEEGIYKILATRGNRKFSATVNLTVPTTVEITLSGIKQRITGEFAQKGGYDLRLPALISLLMIVGIILYFKREWIIERIEYD